MLLCHLKSQLSFVGQEILRHEKNGTELDNEEKELFTRVDWMQLLMFTK